MGFEEERERSVVMGVLVIKGTLLGNLVLVGERFTGVKVAIDEI